VRHTISGLVRNRLGILARITAAFYEQKISIESIAVGETDLMDTSRLTMVVEADGEQIEAISSELEASDDIIELDDLALKEFVQRELALIKVQKQGDVISQLAQIAELFNARVISVGNETVTFEVTGDEERVEGFIRMMHPFGIKALARTGRVALEAGDEV
jgi:acetolactate synthase-1/3 small subunit